MITGTAADRFGQAKIAAATAAVRYRTIDSWRGVAALAVLLFHSFGSFYHQPVWAPLEPIRAIAKHGWLGLHLFFVLSGYCIFERIQSALRLRERPLDFLFDRGWRILPVYWCALAVSVILNLATATITGAPAEQVFPRSIGYWSANLSVVHVLAGKSAYILVTWTLACEVVFYATAAILLQVARSTGGVTAAFGAGALLCGFAFWVPMSGWTLPLATWPDFLAGMAVAFILRGSRRLGYGVLAILSLAALLPFPAFASDERRGALAFAWVLLALYPADDWLAERRAVRVLAWVGMFSYSLYLLHVQLASRVLNLSTRFIDPSSPTFGIAWLAALGVAVLGSWLFWRAIERRSEGCRHQYRLRWMART